MNFSFIQAETSTENVIPIPFGQLAEKWENRFKELVEFHRNHGHLNVPLQYADNPSLGTWANAQRAPVQCRRQSPAA